MYASLWGLQLPKLSIFWLNICLNADLCFAPNLKPVKSERSNFTQVLSEFRVPKNSFHVLPKVLKTLFESLENAL